MSLRRQFHQREWWTSGQIRAFQERQLQRVREVAYSRSAFYRRFHKGLTKAPLSNLPILTKAAVMENFADLVTDPRITLDRVKEHLRTARGVQRFLERYMICGTSGSTGQQGIFIFNSREWARTLAATGRVLDWAGFELRLTRPTRVANVASSIPWHISAKLQASGRNFLVPMLSVGADQDLATIVSQLNNWQPDILQAYASSAHVLAHEQMSGRLHISPRAVVASSEILTPETRRLIEKAWGIRPFNHYGTTETGMIASECDRHQGLHLYEDLVIVEVVDENNHPVPDGAVGAKLLLTSLFGLTQPLIRYEVADVVRMAAQPCACGRALALIEDIQGRSGDVLFFPGRDGGEVAIQAIIFEDVMDEVPAREWQLVQEKQTLKLLVGGLRQDVDERSVAELIQEWIVSKGAITPPVQVHRVDAIPRGATGKAPLITSDRGHTNVC
jgi:putative adenylate-forming enzyme